MFARSVVASLLFVSLNAAAAVVTVDFNGLTEGQSPGAAYADKGVIFEGGTVRYNHLGAYVASPVTARFSQPVNNLSFGADGLTIDTNSTVCFMGGAVCEPQYLGSVSWMPGNMKRDDWYPGQTWLTSWRFPDITSVRFVTESLTSLSWTVPDALPAAGLVTGEVPLPGTAWLLAVGALALYRRSK